MELHIDNMTIRAYRGLCDVELHGLGRINLLVGANNSGKTTVLEAVSTFCRPLDPLELLNAAKRREIKSSREPLLDALRWLFPQQGAHPEDPYYTGEICIEATGRFQCVKSTATFQGLVGEYESDGTVTPLRPDHENNEDAPSSERTDNGESLGTDRFDERGADITLTATSRDGVKRQEVFQIWESERFVSRGSASEPVLAVATVSPFAHRVEQFQVSQLSEATLTGKK